MPVEKGAQVPSEQRHCAKENKTTEWRRYALRKNAAGEQLYQWRCHSCLSQSDRRAKIRRRNDELVSLGLVEPKKLTPRSGRVSEEIGKMVIEAWKVWCESTGRPDSENVNIEFAGAYSNALKNRSHEELLSVVRVASFIEPNIDVIDVTRVVNALINPDYEVTARRKSALGGEKLPFVPRPFKYSGVRGVVARAKEKRKVVSA